MKTFLSISLGVLLVACSASNQPAIDNAVETRRITLSNEQVQTVHNGVKQMITNPDTAEFSGTTAVTLAGKQGIHVCGYVKYMQANGTAGAAQAYYLELRELSGKPSAERGQVALDQLKRSKVTFMCRHNN